VHINNADKSGVKAVEGFTGFYDGRDYRDVSVLACLSAVDQTPWFMVTKVDKSEMFSELYPEAFMLLIIMVLLISLTWAIFSFLQNKQQGLIYKSLWESEAKYKAFFENSLDAIMITHPDGAILSANPAACNLFGYTEEEIIALGRSGIVDITDPMLSVLIEKRKREGKVISELNFVRKDGTRFTAEFTSAVFDDSRGEKKTSMIIRDMTRRKEDEKKIIELNDHLNSLINTLKELSASHDMATIQNVITLSARELTDPDGVTFVLRDGDFCYFADENAISPLWKGQRLKIEECICGWAMLNKQTVMVKDVSADPRINAEHYKKSFVKSLVVVPVIIENFEGAIGIYWSSGNLPSDIVIRLLESLSDAAAVAVENVRLYDDLETRVRDRTTQLTAANKELEAFSYSVSHDLRAPLRAINGFTKILSEEYSSKMSEKETRLFSLILDNAVKMDQLINDLLAFSRLGRKEPKKSIINMKKMVDLVYNEVIDNELKEIVTLETEDIPDGYGDANMIHLVWANLISNAIKFSSKKETPHIKISGEQIDSKTVYFIKDNGAGFDMSYSSRLFQAFQRLHSSADFEGTGVGLALIQRIIYRHGGEVWAEGEVDKGATFWFSLPVGNKK
jgi:PAS domain S-box-containing protein